MVKFVIFTLIVSLPIPAIAEESKGIVELRAKIVAALTKFEELLLKVVKPEPKPTPDNHTVKDCECKGTGFITHGDGHKTVCPCEKCGCNKKKGESVVVQPPKLHAHIKVYSIPNCSWCVKWKNEIQRKVEDAGWKVEPIDASLPENKEVSNGITEFPTFDVYFNGQPVRKKGFMSLDHLRQMNDKYGKPR